MSSSIQIYHKFNVQQLIFNIIYFFVSLTDNFLRAAPMCFIYVHIYIYIYMAIYIYLHIYIYKSFGGSLTLVGDGTISFLLGIVQFYQLQVFINCSDIMICIYLFGICIYIFIYVYVNIYINICVCIYFGCFLTLAIIRLAYLISRSSTCLDNHRERDKVLERHETAGMPANNI